MCARCEEWIRPNLTCACPDWTASQQALFFHADGHGVEEAHEDALEVEKLLELLRVREGALAWARVIDTAHDEALVEANEREYAARRKRELVIAGILGFLASIYILRAVLWWFLWSAGR
jgi:hypothetical protein